MFQRLLIGVLSLALYGYFFVGADQMTEFTRIAEAAVGVAPSAPSIAVSAPSVNGALTANGLVDPTSGFLIIDKTVTALGDLKPAGEQTDRKYERRAFGAPWADVDGNGCDTRNDVLTRDLREVTYAPGGICVVATGFLTDPYTGKTVPFTKKRASEIPIDHVVALSWAWSNGASGWTPEQRQRFANDPMNLTATTRDANSAKSDRGPSQWRPANEAYRCEYIARFVYVTGVYGLTIGDGDRNAARRGLAACQ